VHKLKTEKKSDEGKHHQYSYPGAGGVRKENRQKATKPAVDLSLCVKRRGLESAQRWKGKTSWEIEPNPLKPEKTAIPPSLWTLSTDV